MKQEILIKLKNDRKLVQKRYEEMVHSAKMRKSPTITSQLFFFNVVANHFKNMGKNLENKCIKSEDTFILHLNKAIEKAEYACAKPARISNSKKYFFESKYGM